MAHKSLNPQVDAYLTQGCMRCKLGGTPHCKVHRWETELKTLRAILLDCGLTEELKWSQPCYTYQQRNIVMMSAFKEYCALTFMKGSLLKDTYGLLIKPGENTQAGRQIRFTCVKDITKLEPVLREYIHEAIEIEKSGKKPVIKKDAAPIPVEFQNKLEEWPALKEAFAALTPGRQRAYILYFSAPKQSKTRASRIEKYIQKIMEGKGLND
ncbi:MAG: YdeI/OmpD-associated family protein [Alicyclobacillus sp.]|nr:YdeI/OmpD-associated family protein [Alicyclobacillus sp.]